MLTNHYIFAILDKTNGIENIELQVNSLTAEQLKELFDVDGNKKLLKEKQSTLNTKLSKLEEQQTLLTAKLFNWPQISS